MQVPLAESGVPALSVDRKRKPLEEAVRRNSDVRLAVLRERLLSMPDMPVLEFLESMAESTILACVGDIGNASLMASGLIKIPEFAADVYRAEIGATEALWEAEIGSRLPASPHRTRVAVHLVPYAVRACMAFGFWLAALHHEPATAQAHARQYAGGIVDAARGLLMSAPQEPASLPAPQLVA